MTADDQGPVAETARIIADVQTHLQERVYVHHEPHRRGMLVDEQSDDIGDRLTEAHERLRNRVPGGSHIGEGAPPTNRSEDPAVAHKQEEILAAHRRVHDASEALMKGFHDVAQLEHELAGLM